MTVLKYNYDYGHIVAERSYNGWPITSYKL